MIAASIAVTINGRPTTISADLTVAALLRDRDLPVALVAVEYNGRILRRDEFDEVVIRSGDRLEIVHFVGGG